MAPLTAQPDGRADRPVVAVGSREPSRGSATRSSGADRARTRRPCGPLESYASLGASPRSGRQRLHAAGDVARAIVLGGAEVTVLVMAGTADQVGLIAELVEVARQFDLAVDSDPSSRSTQFC